MALDHDGDMAQVQGSGSKPYELKNQGGVISCSCPAWRNQSLPIDKRTCKHIKQVRGAAVEAARVGATFNAPAAAPTAPGPSPASRPSVSGSVAAGRWASGVKLRQDEKAKLFGPPVLLAHSFEDYEDELDVRDWWVSEKLDGVRAYWNGKDFISRQGNVFHAPAWFKAGLPSHPLDGELWMGRGMFQKTLSVVRSIDAGERWKGITYVVFDHPSHAGTFEDRMTYLLELGVAATAPHMRVLKHDRLDHLNHLLKTMEDLVAQGAEGVMIRKPGSLYEVGKSSTLLKVKPFKDSEAVIVGHVPGKGRHKGRLGGLEVRMPDGKTFNVGTGLSDEERRNPPAIGKTITYRFTELTDGGIPKCASFVAVRDYE